MDDLKIEIFPKPQQITLGNIRLERYSFRAFYDSRMVTTGKISRAVSQYNGIADSFYFDLLTGNQTSIPHISRIDTVGIYHGKGFATQATIAANQFSYEHFGVPIHSDIRFDCQSSKNCWIRLTALGAAELVPYVDDGRTFERWRMKRPGDLPPNLIEMLSEQRK